MIGPTGEPPRYCFANLSAAGVVHGVFTRLGGRSRGRYASLNVGHLVGDNPVDVQANESAIFGSLGLVADRVISCQQVHGDRVAWVTDAERGATLPATDGLMTMSPNVALLLRFADCVPVLLAVPRLGAVALVHAGWKGTVAGIAGKAARLFAEGLGCAPSEVLAGIGPSIGPCCYEVGPEVVAAVRAIHGGEGWLVGPVDHRGHAYMDLWAANVAQLQSAGVRDIECANLCTRCHSDVFYSHRGDGPLTGRFAVVIRAPGGEDE